MSKQDSFIEKAKLIHQNKYDYSLVEYQSSHIKIIIVCPTHGQFNQTPADHTHKKAGCKECAKINRKNTNLEKYGFDHPRKNKEVQERQKLTNLAKYGFENAAKSESVRNKRNATNLERYGNICTAQSPEIKEKIRISMLEKYGITHPNQQHMAEVLNKLNDFGYMHTEYIIIGNAADTIASELGIDATTVLRYLRKLEIEIREVRHSYISIDWLISVANQDGVYIQHNGNIGEYRIPGTRYKADGYCQETNTIYEFHGDYWHGNPKVYSPDMMNEVVKKPMSELYANTIERENQIISLGYNLVVMWESDFWLNHL